MFFLFCSATAVNKRYRCLESPLPPRNLQRNTKSTYEPKHLRDIHERLGRTIALMRNRTRFSQPFLASSRQPINCRPHVLRRWRAPEVTPGHGKSMGALAKLSFRVCSPRSCVAHESRNKNEAALPQPQSRMRSGGLRAHSAARPWHSSARQRLCGCGKGWFDHAVRCARPVS